MRTTVRLDERLMREVKRYAAARDKTLTKVIEEALQEKLALGGPPKPFTLRTARGGLRPGVNLDHNAETLELLEGGLDVVSRR